MLERFWGAGVADPEEKRLRNAWEAPRLRVTFAAGLAVSLGATGAGRAFPAPAPGSSCSGAPRVQVGDGGASVRIEMSLLPAFCLWAPEFSGACKFSFVF